MGKALASAGVEGDGPDVSLAVLGWGATAAGHLAGAAQDELDDLIVTSRRTYHLVRQLEGGGGQLLLVYLRLDRARSNLAVARRALAGVRASPAPVPRRREAGSGEESAAQGAPDRGSVTTGPGSSGSVAALARPRAPLPRRHQVAALPLPRRSGPTGRAVAMASSARAPLLPRRTAAAAPPMAPAPVDRPDQPALSWADDIATMQRLLAGLQRLR